MTVLAGGLIEFHLNLTFKVVSQSYEEAFHKGVESGPFGMVVKSQGVVADFGASEHRRVQLRETEGYSGMQVVQVHQKLADGSP